MAALGEAIRVRRGAARLSQRDLAERAGLSNAYLSQVERGLHEPSIRVLQSIASALGVQLDLLLSQAGLVGDPDVDTAAAIAADPRLSEPQRFAMLSIYRSYVGGI